MKIRIVVAICSLLLSTINLTAQDFGNFFKGVDAYEALDYVTAMNEWRIIAVQGDGNAQVNIGILYEGGKGVTRDRIRALMWYIIGEANGSSNASRFEKYLSRSMSDDEVLSAQNASKICLSSRYKDCGW